MPQKRFSFISHAPALDQETFGVVQFSGVEGISLPYEFEIMLVSDNPDIDIDKVMEASAKFTLHREKGGDVDFHGILNSFEQLHRYNEYVFYRAHLVPRLWWLCVTHHNQVCLNKSVPEIIELTLKDSGLTNLDFEFKIQGAFEPLEYVCQYNENHFNFISRWLEREGLYYYFDQKGAAEKAIFTDTYIAHTDLPDVHYAPSSGLLEDENTEVIHSFICRQRQLPRKIYFKDYNYERPSLGISGSSDVDKSGRGTDYIYGEYFPSSEEGDRLAGIRAQTLNCRKREFTGESNVPFLEPGYTFTLHHHYRDSFNQRYLVESVSHEGNQVGYLLPGVSEGLPGHKSTIYYKNSFTAIPANVQFRSEQKATRPHIAGTLHAVIDAEGSGRYAELDDQGRYKVRLPFDENGDHKNGKASAYLRMMQPYANQKGGMQFPLTKGTEVLLTFIGGDPDRPVIAGAVANPETPSPVTSKNQTESVIQTGGNNKIRMEDKKGKERIIMESPTAGSWVRIGAPNDPPDPYTVLRGASIARYTDSTGAWSLDGPAVDTNDLSNNNKYLLYYLNKQFTVAKVVSASGAQYKVGDEVLGATLDYSTEYTIEKNKWKLVSDLPSNTQYPCSLTFRRFKCVKLIIIDSTPVVDQDPTEGIKINTTGELAEASSGNQQVNLIDPNFATTAFALSDGTLTSIWNDISRENDRVQQNIDSLNSLLATATLEVKPKYTEKIAFLTSMMVLETDYKNKLKSISANNRSDFIAAVKDKNSPFSTIPGKNDIIIDAILRNTLNMNSKARSIAVDGDIFSISKGSNKMSAIDGGRRIEMTDGGILINAGTDNDITVRCKHFFVENQEEDNVTYGVDNAEHYGDATETFYGKSNSTSFGDATDTFVGRSNENFFGGKGELFLGGTGSFNLAESFEMFIGAKEEIHLGEKFEFFFLLRQALSLAGSTDFFFGAKTELSYAIKTEIVLGTSIKNKASPELEFGSLTWWQKALTMII